MNAQGQNCIALQFSEIQTFLEIPMIIWVRSATIEAFLETEAKNIVLMAQEIGQYNFG